MTVTFNIDGSIDGSNGTQITIGSLIIKRKVQAPGADGKMVFGDVTVEVTD